jgi:hypothetical protein
MIGNKRDRQIVFQRSLHVCPEPVLVNVRFLRNKWSDKKTFEFSHLSQQVDDRHPTRTRISLFVSAFPMYVCPEPVLVK